MEKLKYSFPDNNYAYTTYESAPKTTKISLPLGDIDVEDFGYIGDNGAIIVNDNLNLEKEDTSKLIINNSKEMDVIPNDYSTNTYSINPSLTGRPKQAVEFFKSKFINDLLLDELIATRSAMAIVGNLMYESGDATLNKTDNIGDKNLGKGNTAYGIGQWRLDRQDALRNFAAKKGKPMSDFNTLLEFVWSEINGSQKPYKVLEGLINSKSLEEATESFMKTFERPNKNPEVNKLKERIKHAKSLL